MKNGSRDRFGNLRVNVGGRPKKVVSADTPEKKVQGNRKKAGSTRQREFSAQEKLLMILQVKAIHKEVQELHQESSEHARVQLESQAIRRRFPTLGNRKKVRKLLAQEERLRKFVQERRLGADILHPSRKSLSGIQMQANSSQVLGVGCRALGGGRKNKFLKFWQQVKIWHTCERLSGVQIDALDIYWKFKDVVNLEIKLLQHFQDKGKLPADQSVWLEELKQRLAKLEASSKYQDMYIGRLAEWAGIRFGAPSRCTSMSLPQEKLGWEVSMKSYDHALWLATLGSAEDLRGHVALPQQFVEHRKDLVLAFSDQVPVWLKLGVGKQIAFAAHELVKSSHRSKKFKEGAEQRPRKTNWIQESQKLDDLPSEVSELAGKAAEEAMSQRRSGAQGAPSKNEKFRVTLECRQAVLGFMGDQPRSVQLPPILISYGVHCRLSNISKDRRWIQDEELEVGGVRIVRKAGEKLPPMLMRSWTDLRDLKPELFEHIVVVQQPSATADEVIVGWSMEDLSLRFPAVLLQRDLVSGALSSRARMAAHLSQVICCWVGPGMTPVVQITDTDVAFPLKAKIKKVKQIFEQSAKVQALKEGRPVSYAMGPRELMEVLMLAVREFKQEADASNLVLKALRRNGMLAYYPFNGKFEKIDENICPWMKKLEIGDLGGHRYPKSWLDDRFSWLSSGVPIAPKWQDVMTSEGNQDIGKQEISAELSALRLHIDRSIKVLLCF